MSYFNDILTIDDLKKTYRRLAMTYHPDLGGNVRDMQRVNEEYKILNEGFTTKPSSLKDIKVGHTVYVNSSKCVVTKVERNVFIAKSLETKRETYFSKNTGYAMLNFKFKASVICEN